MHVYLELGGIRTEPGQMVRTYDMACIYVLLVWSFSFVILDGKHVKGRKLRGRSTRVCSHYSCMICQQDSRWQHFPEIRRFGNGSQSQERNLMF